MNRVSNVRFIGRLCTVTKFILSSMALIELLGGLLLGWFQNPPPVTHAGNATIYANYSEVSTSARIGIILILAAILVWVPKIPRIF